MLESFSMSVGEHQNKVQSFETHLFPVDVSTALTFASRDTGPGVYAVKMNMLYLIKTTDYKQYYSLNLTN